MLKKLHISLIFSNLVVVKTLNSNHRMHNLYANFVKILGVCKQFAQDLVNEKEKVHIQNHVVICRNMPFGQIRQMIR